MHKTSKVASLGLLIAVSVLAVLGIMSNATASPSLRSVGVAVLQFGCGLNSSFGNLYGPATVPMNSFSDCPGKSLSTVPTPVPKGGLYALRVNSLGGTTAGQLPVLQFTVYDGSTPTQLTCTTTTALATCSDFTHTYLVGSEGHQVWVSVSVPDNNSFLSSASVTMEQAIFH